MKCVAFITALLTTPSTSSSRALSGMLISAAPMMTLNSTTAGTMLFASELNGLVGM